MYELHPYFTNDGSVGLFSPQDDDIYHSTYGALSESCQKFILPAHLADYISTHNSVKILDICYGIGYNSKSAMNIFLNAIEKNNKNAKNISKKYSPFTTSIAAIDTDNIYRENNNKNTPKNKNICINNSKNIEAIYADNIYPDETKEFLLDAVDTDKILIKLSPFITNKLNRKSCCKFKYDNEKYKQIKKIQKSELNILPKEFEIKDEVLILLLEKLIERNPDYFNDEIMEELLRQKKNHQFYSKYMLNLAKFYKKRGYKKTSAFNISTFLHNIYYKYISKSYKNAHEVLKNNKIYINYFAQDARKFLKSTNITYNFIFLDAFTPAKCPSLWTKDFFALLYDKLEQDGMILTYSNSAAVRNALLQNNFFVGKIYDMKLKKFVGTVATKNNDLIDYKLNDYDLGLINSKAGICWRDEDLESSNLNIIKNRDAEVINSDLSSSSKFIKGYHEKNTKKI